MDIVSLPVFISALATETNTFSPVPAGRATWEEAGLIRRDASLEDPAGVGANLLCYRKLAEADGLAVTESLSAFATPAAPTARLIYEELRDFILEDLKAAGPVAFVMLALHGAMIADGYDDCEGDLIAHVREIVGTDIPIGVELDPHCHLTEIMIDGADAIVLMKEYPHTDFSERAAELYAICKAAALGLIKPVMATFDCRMIGFYPTTIEPMAGLVRMAKRAELEPGILSVSIVHGFPWADQRDSGTRILVVADTDKLTAQRVADRLGRAVYSARQALLPRMPSIDEALSQAIELGGLVVLADTADNAGGGAPGDGTPLLAALLASKIGPSVFGMLYDQGAVRICQEAGRGSELPLRIGGKLGKASGEPLDVVARIMALRDQHVQTFLGQRISLGACAWIRVGLVDIVLSSIRSQVFGTDALTDMGITLADKRVVAVKSSEHFRTSFQKVTDQIITVATPGALQMDFAGLHYEKKRDLDFYPRCLDPLGLDA